MRVYGGGCKSAPLFFTVTYQSDFGTVPEKIIVEENTILTTQHLPVLSEEGYSFDGWYDEIIKAEPNEYKITKDVVLVAKWKKIEKAETETEEGTTQEDDSDLKDESEEKDENESETDSKVESDKESDNNSNQNNDNSNPDNNESNIENPTSGIVCTFDTLGETLKALEGDAVYDIILEDSIEEGFPLNEVINTLRQNDHVKVNLDLSKVGNLTILNDEYQVDSEVKGVKNLLSLRFPNSIEEIDISVYFKDFSKIDEWFNENEYITGMDNLTNVYIDTEKKWYICSGTQSENAEVVFEEIDISNTNKIAELVKSSTHLMSEDCIRLTGSSNGKISFKGSFSNKIITKILTDLDRTCSIDFSEAKDFTTIEESLFAQWTNLKNIILPQNATSFFIGKDAFLECSSLESIEIPEGIKTITIEEGAFAQCASLKNIIIPKNTTSIFIGKSAFLECSSLESIEIPEGIKTITIEEGAFAHCTSLKSIEIPEGLKTIEYFLFYGCSSLEKVVIPDSVSEIKECAFAECRNLTIKIPKNVTKIEEGTFQFSESFRIEIPAGVTEIHEKAFSYATNCFIVVDENNPYFMSTEEGALYNKDKTTLVCWHNPIGDVTIPEGVKKIISMSESSITSIKLPDSLEYIGEFAFYCCDMLEKITIPKNVNFIGECAFYRVRNHSTITFTFEDPNNWYYINDEGEEVLFDTTNFGDYNYSSPEIFKKK